MLDSSKKCSAEEKFAFNDIERVDRLSKGLDRLQQAE